MKLSSALALALALGWARENASYTPFSIPQRRRHAFLWKELSSTSPSSSSSSSLASSPHPPDEPPSNDLLNLYYASTPSQMSSDQQQQQQQPEQTRTQESSTTTTTTTTIETTSIPAKPWMTEEQKEEINVAANRFVQEVWKPLFESSVQPGVPADTIKGAALVGATLAFLASKGLVVTSAAGVSAAYVAISQGVAGDVLRTMGGIAWDVTETATKLLQMATTTDQMTGISKELVDKVAMAMQETRTRASALQELGDKNNNNNNNNPTSTSTTTTTTANVQEATEAFLESQDELARVLREAETAIGAADAAIAQAEQTLWQDQLETTTTTTTTQGILDLSIDLSVPYNAAAKLAYEASDKSMPFDDFELEYLAESIAVVKSKHQASKLLLLEQAKQKMEQEKREQEEAAQRKAAEEAKARIVAEQEAKRKASEAENARIVEEQEAKRKAAEAEEARIAAEQEAQRKEAEEEMARLAAEQEAQRKAADEEKARIAAEQETKRKAAEEEEARIAAELEAKRKAAEAEKVRLAAEQEARRKAAEEEKARLAAELEAKRKAAEEEKARIAAEQEAKRKAAEEEMARIAAEQEAKRKAAEEERARSAAEQQAKATIDDEDDDDWLAAVEMAQQGLEGKIVGLEDAIRDESGKASWDAAGALAEELGAFVDDDDDEYELEDLFDAETLEKLGLAARKAVEAFEEEDEIEEMEGDDDDVVDGAKGIDGMYVASSSARSSSSSSRQPIQRDWSALTVAKLKDELRFRGLKAYGKKAELVAMLEAYDRDEFADGNDDDDEEDEEDNFLADDGDSEDELLDLGDLDLEELGRQARAAVELGTLGGFDAEEPSDEVLMQLENEESLLLSDFLGDGKSNKKQTEKDYSLMTVLELKEELRERGLPLSGKKSELIERLQATDLS